MNSRGSEWRKWDLHIHSDASDGSDTCTTIIEQAKTQNLAVIALTDHHTAKNIDNAKKIGLEKGIKVIPGIEFRSEYGERSVHFVGLFPDTHSKITINTKSLTEMILNPLNLSETRIIALGKEKSPELSDEKAFKKGMFLVQVDFKKAADLIHSLSGLVVVHAGTKSNSLDEEMKHKGTGEKNTKELYDSLGTLKEELFTNGYIDICEIRKEGDSEEFYRKTFGKPSVLGSDAHNASDVGSRYTWIKADPTFDGLRQIIYEPHERVSITETRPERKNDYLVIDRVEIDHPDFGSQSILLNANLTSIIGGRSSGKSILLGALAKSVGTDKEVKKGKFEYNKYIEEQVVPKLTVHWCDGAPNVGRKIDYFPQSFINSLAADSKEISTLIENIIRSDPERRARLDEFNNRLIVLRTDINNLVSEYFQTLEVIRGTKESLLALGVRAGIFKQIAKLETELAEVKEKMKITLSADEESRFAQQNREIELSKKAATSVDEDNAILSTLMHPITFPDIASRLASLSPETKEPLQESYRRLSQEFLDKWAEIVAESIVKGKDRKASCLLATQKIESDFNFIKCSEYFKENTTYLEIETQLKLEKTRLELFNSKENELQNQLTEIENKKRLILEKHSEYYTTSATIADGLNYTRDDVKIVCSVRFLAEKYKQILGDRFVQRAYEIQAIVNHEYRDHANFIEHLSTVFDRILDGTIPLRTSTTSQQAIIDVFTNSYFDINYDVLYENDSLSQMSEGKKAFIILRMLLDFNESGYPILIDQPEDDLDNRAIYDEMATYLKKIKKLRQVIVVSHNPNIVVGGDSELVVCANQDGIGNKNHNRVKFEYVAGSLENTCQKVEATSILATQGVKEHVCDILEGGNEAFLQRERKYRIAKEKKA